MLLFVFAAMVMKSCHSPSERQNEVHASFYSDIDLYTGQGKQRLNTDKPLPPCFEVDSVDANEIRLVNWYPRIGSSGLNYTKKGNYWSARSSMRADTANLVVYNYIGKGKFISLEYVDDSSQDKLKSVTIFKDSEETVYRFNTYLPMNPDGDIGSAGKFPADQIREKTVRDYHFENGQLEVIRTTITGLVEPTEKDTIYYKIGAHSLFWWREFGR